MRDSNFRVRRILQKILIYFFLLCFMALILIPFFWMISTSLKPNPEAVKLPLSWLPKVWTLENYISQLTDLEQFLMYYKNGLIVSTLTSVLSLVLAVMAGYSFSRFRYKWQNPILMGILATQMFPGVLLVIAMYFIYFKIGLLNTYLGLVLAFTTFSLPFSIWMMKGFIDTIPREIEEAASIDGASKFGTLTRIVVPMIIPSIIAVFLFSFLVAWNNLLFAITLASKHSMFTVPAGLTAMYRANWQYFWAAAFSGGTIVTIPIIIVFIFLHKYLVAGLTAGAVKE